MCIFKYLTLFILLGDRRGTNFNGWDLLFYLLESSVHPRRKPIEVGRKPGTSGKEAIEVGRKFAYTHA